MNKSSLFIAVDLCLLVCGCTTSTLDYLSTNMDQFHGGLDVYSDADAAGNHFAARGQMSSQGDETALPPMDEACTDNPHSGRTCIRANFNSRGDNWGGWYWMNGVLGGAARMPDENWGTVPNAGLNLKGATTLTFWAKGAKGDECVDFFCMGVGWGPNSGTVITPYPDSGQKCATGFISLTSDWQEYHIDLRGQDTGYVLGGFGWASNALQNNGRDFVFYLDDIRYDCSRLSAPRFLLSFEPDPGCDMVDRVLGNTAFTYDNAVALLAFLAAGEKPRAKLIADALVYAQQHDRFYADGRLRNAYQAGDLTTPPGWTPNGKPGTVRLPGWYDASHGGWCEDSFHTGSHAGNVAWAMIALLAYYDLAGDGPYLAAVEKMAQWIEDNCRDNRGAGGYTGGFDGREPNPVKLTYKATEHNIDLYAAFQRLYLMTGKRQWQLAAEHAKNFVAAMWDPVEGKFWTGTGSDGIEISKGVIPVDIQAWSLLSLGEASRPYWKALDYAGNHLMVGEGFDFNQDRDAVWFEGTAQMALAYTFAGQPAKRQALVDFLHKVQDKSGGLVATDRASMTTGFFLTDGQPWLYYHRLHVGATAWALLAERNVNPFWLGSKEK